MEWPAVALDQNGSIGVANLISTVFYQNTPNILPRLASSVQLIYSPAPILWLCVSECKRWFPSNRRSIFAVMEKADPFLSSLHFGEGLQNSCVQSGFSIGHFHELFTSESIPPLVGRCSSPLTL